MTPKLIMATVILATIAYAQCPMCGGWWGPRGGWWGPGMGWWGPTWGWLWMLLALAIWALFIIALVLAIIWLYRQIKK